MKEEEYLLRIDQINIAYKKKVEDLAKQYIKEKGTRQKGDTFMFAGNEWKIKHARVKIRPFDVPTVIYQCVMVDSTGKETTVKREFFEEDIDDGE